MLVLTTTALPTLIDLRAELDGGELLGRLLTPRHYNRAADTAELGIPWAADCDGFGDFDERRFCAMLDRLATVPPGLFVAAPDTYGSHADTLTAWDEWAHVIRDAGQRPAFVLQPGVEPETVPWGTLLDRELTPIGALFLGGEDAHRARPAIRQIIGRARAYGIWVHVGRVNGRHRARDAMLLGANSIDGSGLARFRDAKLRPVLDTVRNLRDTPPLAMDLDA